MMVRTLRPAWIAAAMLLGSAGLILAQDHTHIGPASGIPRGIPRFCAEAGTTSVGNGSWSNPATWSSNRVPSVGDSVLIKAGSVVTYDVVSAAALKCIDVEGELLFRTDANTQLKVGTLTVLPRGRLEIGSVDRPVAETAIAELVIADQPLDTTNDPGQIGNGLIGLGTITMHGAIKTPTFSRLLREPLAGHTTIQLDQPVSGWKPGDKLVVPDTRQLRENERGRSYHPQWEELTVTGISGAAVTLAAALAFDHRAARDGEGMAEFFPHVGNVSRNVIVRSENPKGTRGHVIFVTRPDVDVRYVLFKDLGRTRMGVLHNTEYIGDRLVQIGTNQIGRYSIHFHHAFGPKTPPANGYQFTLIGNAVDDASKWGITIHNSHYGLVQDNVVYNSRGAGIVTEDGTESFNVFAHNFAMRSEGSGEFAPRSGYGGATNDPGGEGAGFWFRGPNNMVRDNVAANVDVFGYGIAAGELGKIRVPKFKGADTSQEAESTLVEGTDLPLLEFTRNEAYGAIQTGIAIGWNATLRDSRIWHTSRNGLTALPADRLEIVGGTMRGDPTVLQGQFENPMGIWFANYVSKSVFVRDADIQGMRVGIASPFFSTSYAEPGRGEGMATVENSYFRNYVGVAIATHYASGAGRAKTAIVRSSRFEPLKFAPPAGRYAPAAISMNYGMSSADPQLRDPIVVYDFNKQPGENFRVFYSLELPASAAPCAATRPDISGFVCPVDDVTTTTKPQN